MRTEDLIAGLSRGAALKGPSAGRALDGAMFGGTFVATAILISFVKVRPGIAELATNFLFMLKIGVVTTLAIAAIGVVKAASRTEGALPRSLLIVPGLLIAFGIGHELATHLPQTYMSRLVGTNWAFCLITIPIMGAAPLAAILWALRRSAPASPVLAGAMAGFSAGAIAALLYALHCTDDSPLFVATWYTLAILMLTAIGALVGRKLLDW